MKNYNTNIMGIVNVTTDSFSGDGLGADYHAIKNQVRQMLEDGATIIDIGAESSRPGADPVPLEKELEILPSVVARVRSHFPALTISVDTYKPEVAEACLGKGANIINDISGMRDERMGEVVARHRAGIIIMHMNGEPKTMGNPSQFTRGDVVAEVFDFLNMKVFKAREAGIEHIMVDPGLGFGKSAMQSMKLLRSIDQFVQLLDVPVVIGASRKGFTTLGRTIPPDQRLGASIAAALIAKNKGAGYVRVHDVRETAQAFSLDQSIRHPF